jgi:hypothetical protein
MRKKRFYQCVTNAYPSLAARMSLPTAIMASIMSDVSAAARVRDAPAGDLGAHEPEETIAKTNDSPLPEDGAVVTVNGDAMNENPPQVEADRTDEEDDGTLDVVVTGVEIDLSQGGASVVGAALLLGVQPFVVELVVTRARGSYCIQRDLTTFLNAIAAAPSLKTTQDTHVKCPEFPSKHAYNDAVLAQWCGDVTQYLAGSVP